MKNYLNILTAFAVAFISSLFIGNPFAESHGQYLYEAGSTGSTITVSTCTGCRVVNVKNIPGITADDGISDSASFSTYANANKSDVVYFFPRGVYNWSSQVSLDGMVNVAFVGEKGATIRKNGTPNADLVLANTPGTSGYSGEWILNMMHSTNITVSGLRFEGLTTSTNDYDYGEQGIYCGSCNRWLVTDNEFWNFGDAAARSSTYASDTNGTVQSFNTRIIGNYFNNIFQVSTTPNDTPVGGIARGGTQGLMIKDNIADNVKGSFKVCARHETHGAQVIGNIINNSSAVSTSVGIEMCSVSDIIAANNYITGSQLWGITYYTNDGFGLNGWDWNNINISHNIIRDVFRGIRMSNSNYPGDNYHSNSRGIVIDGNSIFNVTGNAANGGVNPAIYSSNTFGSGIISNNVCGAISGLVCAQATTGITAVNNIID